VVPNTGEACSDVSVHGPASHGMRFRPECGEAFLGCCVGGCNFGTPIVWRVWGAGGGGSKKCQAVCHVLLDIALSTHVQGNSGRCLSETMLRESGSRSWET